MSNITKNLAKRRPQIRARFDHTALLSLIPPKTASMDVIYPLALLPPQRNVQHRLTPPQDCCIKYLSKTAYDMKPRRAAPPLPSQQEENVPEKAQDGLQKSTPMNERATAHPLSNIGIATGKGARERRQPEKKQEQIASQRCGGIPTVPYFDSIAKPQNSIWQHDQELEPEKSMEQIQESQPSSSIEQRIEGGYIQQFHKESRVLRRRFRKLIGRSNSNKILRNEPYMTKLTSSNIK